MDLLEVKSIYKTYGSGETAVRTLKDSDMTIFRRRNIGFIFQSLE
jgi:ABC-type lipoprotein export system ATPase subunit